MTMKLRCQVSSFRAHRSAQNFQCPQTGSTMECILSLSPEYAELIREFEHFLNSWGQEFSVEPVLLLPIPVHTAHLGVCTPAPHS